MQVGAMGGSPELEAAACCCACPRQGRMKEESLSRCKTGGSPTKHGVISESEAEQRARAAVEAGL